MVKKQQAIGLLLFVVNRMAYALLDMAFEPSISERVSKMVQFILFVKVPRPESTFVQVGKSAIL